MLEMPRYLALSNGVANSVNPMEWWPLYTDELPTFSKIAKKIALIAPTSAESERVFSVLKSFISKKQASSMKETLEATVMLRYNHIKI